MVCTKIVLYTIALLVITTYIPHTLACLCKLIKFKCPAPPTCCESGQYALDECGCCLKCAKAELQTCGGANDISGRCASGLQCLKTCLPCKTVGDKGKPCIFPFEYSGRTYDRCTTRDSDNGQPWCATEVDDTGYVVDNAWGDCLEGCPGTRVECDDKYFSIQEGKCIDVSVPGAIPNWFGAPAVKLLNPTTGLVPAPVCKNKGAAVRLYDNTCRCVRGETAVDLDLRGSPRGNCTGLEDDASDNLDKVWCFLENIRDPLEPKSGCYSDTRWSERDGRFWSSLACFQAPDIEGGNNPAVHPGSVNRNKISSRKTKPRKFTTTRPTTRRTTRQTTRRTTTKTTTRRPTSTIEPLEQVHTFDFSSDYEYSDYDEYYEDDEEENVDRGFSFIPGETNLPGFEEKAHVDQNKENEENDDFHKPAIFGPLPPPIVEEPTPAVEEPTPIIEEPTPIVEEPTPIVEEPTPIVKEQTTATLKSGTQTVDRADESEFDKEDEVKDALSVSADLLDIQTTNTSANFVDGASTEISTDYVQDIVDFEDATETIEIDIFDDLDELINEINQQNTGNKSVDKVEERNNDPESKGNNTSLEDELNSLFKDVINLNIRNPTTIDDLPSSESLTTTSKPTRQRKQRPKKISQPTQNVQSLNSLDSSVTRTDINTSLNQKPKPQATPVQEEATTIENGILTTNKPRRKQKPRKRSQKNKQRKRTRQPSTGAENAPDINIPPTIVGLVGPQSLEDAGYELYTEQDLNAQTTTTPPDFFFGININL